MRMSKTYSSALKRGVSLRCGPLQARVRTPAQQARSLLASTRAHYSNDTRRR